MSMTYRAVGRYMSGSKVTGYHLLRRDGKQLAVTKDRAIYMIGKGLVENMRIQANKSDLIIRGKGVNLNTLPIYDENKQGFRDNKASQAAANSAVQPKVGDVTNLMGQYTITKRIMHKTSCLGYVVVDHSGKERRFSRKHTINLAIQKLISNAVVQKYNAPGESKPRLILRGAGVSLTKLPVIIVDGEGKLVDPSKDNVKMRAARMRKGGILYDTVNGKRTAFKPGDRLVCGLRGEIKVVKAEDFQKMFKMEKGESSAICDNYLSEVEKYPIEIFGTEPRSLKAEHVMRWGVVRELKN